MFSEVPCLEAPCTVRSHVQCEEGPAGFLYSEVQCLGAGGPVQ